VKLIVVSFYDFHVTDTKFELGFDMVLVELFGTLCYGGYLILKNPEDPFHHLKLSNAIVATTSLLSALSPEDYSNLEVVLLAGEAVHQALADTWSNKVRTLLNVYGPSEVSPKSSY
jgi:gliotoxin/aspirochlorine biosynthesis peptide synthetase